VGHYARVMHLVRYAAAGATSASVGLLEAGEVTALPAATIGELLGSGADALRETLDSNEIGSQPARR
jgi:hypothetical protein